MSTEVAEVPQGTAQVTTPSGLEIFFQSHPKRLYRIRDLADCTGQTIYHDVAGTDDPDFPWIEVPSASSITDVISKPLQWWGQGVGVEGVLTLIERGDVFQPEDEQILWIYDEDRRATAQDLVSLLTKNRLTVNHETRATTRGTNVHKALEAFAETKAVPDPKFYPETEAGYIAGLKAFILDAHPHPLMSEVMVASLDGYAGRFDLVCNLDFAGEVVTKLYPKKPPVRTQLSGSWLIDLKTSSGVWPSYHFQVAGYLNALEECGYPVPEHAGILRVTNDGRYELVECNAMYSDFQNALALYQSVKRIGK